MSEEHVKDLYEKFKNYFIKNRDEFFQIQENTIRNAIIEEIYGENNFQWNINSLRMYISALIKMIKGQRFNMVINNFAKDYFLSNIDYDFGSELYNNAKESLRLHEEYIYRVRNAQNNERNDEIREIEFRLKIKNIMLYGAPGVGKTYNYKKLISLIEGRDFDESKIFDFVVNNKEDEIEEGSVEELYKKIENEKRVEFVTFHQSYSYEDFIEGFRPNENGNIKLEDGIFKEICRSAFGKIKLNNKYWLSREIKSDRSSYIIERITNDLIYVKKDKDNKFVPIPKDLLLGLIENIKEQKIVLEDIKNRNLDNLETKFDKYMYGYNSILYTLCKNVINKVDFKEEQKNFYIVIDEINRGNISKIFGELITLIEEDKRDNLEVTLPYSKEKFKIPSNLYIIATMNSTDKSIATIDIALRRRFTFLKMSPNPELIKNSDAQNLMIEINEFIEKTRGEDYMLGHSYFMSGLDLEFIKEYKIKPLLEEYFYGDEENYKKAISILGE